MRLGSRPTILLALVLGGPTLWGAFVNHSMDPKTALLRFLLAIVVAAAMLTVLRWIVNAYRPLPPVDGGEQQEQQEPLRVEAVAGEPMPPRLPD